MKNIKYKILNVTSVFLMMVLSPDLKAQSLALIPTEIWINKFNTTIGGSLNEFSQNTSFNFSNGQVVSNQVSIQGQFKLIRLAPDEQSGLLSIQAVLNQTTVLAKDLQIQVQVEQNFSFGSATINFSTLCSAITVSLKTPQNVTLKLDKNLQVQDLQTNFELLNLETQIEGCQSIGGLKEEIQSRIFSLLKSQILDRQLKEILSNEIKNKINLNVKKVTDYFVESKTQEIKTKFKLDEKNRLWLYIGDQDEGTFSSGEVAELSQSLTPAAIMRKSQIELSLLKNLNAQLKDNPISSIGNPDLEGLTCSRWAQFFVWPALRAFPKCFNMQFVSIIEDIKLMDLKKLKFSIQSLSWAQAKEPFKNIAYFRLKMKAQLNPTQVKINSISARHDSDFLNWSNRSSRISTDLVAPTLQTYLQNQLVKALDKNTLLNPKNIKNIKLLNSDLLLIQLK